MSDPVPFDPHSPGPIGETYVMDAVLCQQLEAESKARDGMPPSDELRRLIAEARDRIETRAEARDVLRRLKNVKVDSSPRDTQQKP